MTPLVSIVMPVLNPHREHFPLAVESMLGQTLNDFELLIVEDPPDSSTGVRAGALLPNPDDPRLRIVSNKERTGLLQQLNQGVAASRAPWIARMDADDIAQPQRLEKQLAFLDQADDLDVLGCQLRLIDSVGKPLGFRRYPTDHAGIVSAMRRYNPLPHPGVVMRRQPVVDVGGYTADGHAQDYDLWCRLAASGCRFANHPEVLLDYRLHQGATKARHLRNTLESTLAVKRRHFNGTLGLHERFRMAGEVLALRLPPNLVMRLFRRLVVDR
jgi:glycosyltransferase involved in cell wall biosynthesis